MEGFLFHIERNGSFSCYEEYFQGPCPKGHEYILDIDTNEPICVHCPEDSDENDVCVIQLTTRLGMDLFSGISECEEGYGKDGRGECVKKIINNRKNKIRPPRSASFGQGRSIRNYCCSE